MLCLACTHMHLAKTLVSGLCIELLNLKLLGSPTFRDGVKQYIEVGCVSIDVAHASDLAANKHSRRNYGTFTQASDASPYRVRLGLPPVQHIFLSDQTQDVPSFWSTLIITYEYLGVAFCIRIGATHMPL